MSHGSQETRPNASGTLKARLETEAHIKGWASHVDARTRWRLVHSKADGWCLTHLTGTGEERMPVGADLAKRLARMLNVCPNSRKGTSYQPQQFVTALRRLGAREQRTPPVVGAPVQHDGQDYTIASVRKVPRGDIAVLASTDGHKFYPYAACACGGTGRTVAGLDVVTSRTYEVCTFCRGVVNAEVE